MASRPKDVCIECGNTRAVALKTPAGPLCGPCRGRQRVDSCHVCCRRGPCRFAGTARAICDQCAKPRENCSRCGLFRIVKTRTVDGAPVCDSCYQRNAEICIMCQRERRVVGRHQGRPLCEYCYPRHPASFRDCVGCGTRRKLRRTGLCEACHAEALVDSLFPPDLIHRDPAARGLWAACRSGDAHTVLLAFRRQSIELLREVLANPDLRTHDALDRLGPDQTTRAVRSLLVEFGLLPHIDFHLARFERWVSDATMQIIDPKARRAFTQFATWQHLRQLRERSAPLGSSLARSRRRELRVVIDLLAWIALQGKRLDAITQADMDAWASSGAERHLVGKFLEWCRRNKLSRPLMVRRAPAAQLAIIGTPDAERGRMLREVAVQRSDLEPSTRLAACLLLLYGVRPHQIVALRVRDLEQVGELVSVRFGQQPLFLPAELSLLATIAHRDRSAHRMFAPVLDHEWLFPGRRSGMPITAATLTARLQRTGILVSRVRTGALASLAQALPPSVIADLTGVHLRTAIAWREAVGASNSRYAALRGRGTTVPFA